MGAVPRRGLPPACGPSTEAVRCTSVSTFTVTHGGGPQWRLTVGSTAAFGRHESFPLRFGWITKGLDALADDPKIFTREDATVVLGVGKNMVNSIRYWLQATRVATRDPKTNHPGTHAHRADRVRRRRRPLPGGRRHHLAAPLAPRDQPWHRHGNLLVFQPLPQTRV